MGKGPGPPPYRSLVDERRGYGPSAPRRCGFEGPPAIAILDAKYKLVGDRAEAPSGVSRDDRYQLAGYLAAQEESGMIGVLVYPADLAEDGRERPREDWAAEHRRGSEPVAGPRETTASFSRTLLRLTCRL